MNSKSINTLLSVLMGIIYLISGIAKAADINGFADKLLHYGVPQLYWLAPIVTTFEIALAFTLLFRWSLKTTSFISLIFVGCLTIMLLFGHFVKGIDDCGCFGSFISIPIWLALVRNAVMLIASYWLWISSKNEKVKWARLKVGLITIFSLATFSTSAYEMATAYPVPVYTIGTVTKGTFIESIVPRQGKIVLFVFSPQCPHCIEIVGHVNEVEKQKKYNKVKGVYAKGYPTEIVEKFISTTNPTFELTTIPYDSLSKVTRHFPYFLFVEEGKIVGVADKL